MKLWPHRHWLLPSSVRRDRFGTYGLYRCPRCGEVASFVPDTLGNGWLLDSRGYAHPTL